MHAMQMCHLLVYISPFTCSIYRKRFEGALRLARTGDWAVWRSAGGSGAVGCWVDLAASKGSNVWNLGVLEGTSSLATCWTLAILLVGCEVEGNEEEEVRAENAHTGEGSELLSGALAGVWHPWEVGGGKVGV